MAVFRYKTNIDVTYVQQGYVYFTSRNIKALPERRQDRIRKLISECGGQYADALAEFVTTDTGAVSITMKYNLSDRVLNRLVTRYYRAFIKRKI